MTKGRFEGIYSASTSVIFFFNNTFYGYNTIDFYVSYSQYFQTHAEVQNEPKSTMKFDIGILLNFSLAILEVGLSSVGNSKGNRDQIVFTVKQAENLRKQISWEFKKTDHLQEPSALENVHVYQISGGWIAG